MVDGWVRLLWEEKFVFVLDNLRGAVLLLLLHEQLIKDWSPDFPGWYYSAKDENSISSLDDGGEMSPYPEQTSS